MTRVPVGVRPAKGPLGPLAAYRTARRNVLELIPAEAYRAPFVFHDGPSPWLYVTEPAAVQHVLTEHEAYPKSAMLLRLMQPRRGSNLAVTSGADWRRQRKALAPAFTPQALAAMGPATGAAARDAAERLATRSGEVVDVLPHMVEATTDVICEVMLSGRDAIDRRALTQSVDRLVGAITRVSVFDLFKIPNRVPRPAEVFDQSRARMDRLADRLIADRRSRGPSDPPDVLDLMIGPRDPDCGLDDLEIRNNLLGFLFAGHEPTALSLTWALYLLAFDPEVQAQARAEADAAISGGVARHEDLPRLGFIRQVVEEALRLYPPAGFLTRTAARDGKIGPHFVPKGANVVLPVYAMHRHEGLWTAPNAFDPGRFGPDRLTPREKSAFLPFGGGPRICIGATMAVTEATLILATLLTRLSFALPPGFSPQPQIWFTLRPGTGMKLRISKRPS